MFPRGLNACIGMVRLTNACEEPWPHSHIDAGMGHKSSWKRGIGSNFAFVLIIVGSHSMWSALASAMRRNQ